ncbi:lipopolysaccharide assembly protein LapB [Aestuariibacter sp. AA17]|uniref:Lipopolysaccharide assembly protein B n=1 Tax=Fluctibacter corallii TaxID=2984329 RepID=A0ABT3A6U2_9ALTE|nr:lipopolysaccharide assembly protein LapB [Aestuariibacter sp. AA17]MCV2884071.1 lipopolysaccharide assembly protein LapB [Aestuariibacter sp. AA17]
MLELLFLLLPVAAGYGWVMGRNSVRQAQRKQSKILSRHYYKGINFLLSDQPDKAVDTLIKMINLDSDTAETHIAMGNFFRHRGELDRAIRVHQNLVSQEEIDSDLKLQALKELGKDYMLAGFLERAESSFLKLLDSDKYFLDAQRHLFNIYQTTKEWDKAIKLGESMMKHNGDSDDLCRRISHFYCERAVQRLRDNDISSAEKALKKAIESDEHAVRPWLMLGELAIDQQQYRDAISYLNQIPQRDVSWLSEAVPLIEVCCRALNDEHLLERALEPYWKKCASAYLSKVNLMARQGNLAEASDVLLEQLRVNPTMKGFKTLMGLYVEQKDEENAVNSLTLLSDLVDEQLRQRPKYRCVSCGFSGRQIHWLCPSCKKWGTVKPIKGLDGE